MSTLDTKALDISTPGNDMIMYGHQQAGQATVMHSNKVGVPSPTETRGGRAGLFDSDEALLIPPERTANGMTYEEFKAREDDRLERLRNELEKRGNRAYNNGLLRGLGFRGAWLYPILRRCNV